MDVTAAALSALCGMVNHGMQDAATQLSALLNEAISLVVPHVTISPLEHVLPLLRLGNVQVACIWQQLRGGIDGSAMLLIHPDDSVTLTSALLGNVPSLSEAANGVAQHEAVTEIANIIVSACIAALATRLDLPIASSVPEFFEQTLAAVFDDAQGDLEPAGVQKPAQVMVMPVALTAARRPVNSTLVLMLGAQSMQVLIGRLIAVLASRGAA